jgi:hypothetical protein
LDCGGKRSATPLCAKMARKVISPTAPAQHTHSAFYVLPSAFAHVWLWSSSLRHSAFCLLPSAFASAWLCPAFDSAQADTALRIWPTTTRKLRLETG